MSNTNNLVFFNKEGYPYNFTLNEGVWNGKIFFDPSSTDIFKSLSLYTLESVKSISYTDTMDIVNMEIYNDSGMTLSKATYTNESVSGITSVNKSSEFYTKWIMGTNFNRKFPVGTIITFTGNVNSGMTDGGADFISSMIFTVLNVKRNGIMICTTTSNDLFTFEYIQSTHNLKINSHGCVSIPDFDKDLQTVFNIAQNEKISVVGSDDNDGVYEVDTTGYTMTRILDYNLSSLTTGDTITVRLKLLTDRPLMYAGDIILEGTSTLYMTFVNGRNSNIAVGSTFMCEDNNGNQLMNGNEYTITSIITEKTLGNATLTFSGTTVTDDDGKVQNVYQVSVPVSFGIKVNDEIYFKSPMTGGSLNNNLIRTVISILTGSTSNILTLNDNVHTELLVNYTVIKKLKSYDQNQVIVTSSTAFDNAYNGYARCLLTTNILEYTQQVSDKGYSDAINNFVSKYSNNFIYNGINVYGLGYYLIFDGIYTGQNRYFDIIVFKNLETTPIIIPNSSTYTDGSGNTSVYNLLLQDDIIKYERKNMSNQLSTSYYADITLDIFDDNQDYGFQLMAMSLLVPSTNTCEPECL